jgi:GNAT superfamily N-acetyltransferase/effector-binding domain-containing protein
VVSVLRVTSAHEGFRELVGLLDAEMNALYPRLQAMYDRHNVVDDVQTVVLACVEGQAVGCGALRAYAAETVEVKRMVVRPDWRGQGIAGRILRELEAWAAELGFARIILETGVKQPAAIGLYRKHGYRQIENYGPYASQPNSVCFEKRLDREYTMTDLEVTIKSAPEIRALATRVTSDAAFDPLWEEAREQVTAFAADQGLEAAGPLMGVFYEDPADPDCGCDFAVALPTDDPVDAEGAVFVLTLPAVERMATTVCPGSITADEADKLYAALLAWIDAFGYRIDGPYRELFHPAGEGRHASETVIEIQFPITPQSHSPA